MTSRERVIATIQFNNPGPLPLDLPQPYGSDFHWVEPNPSPDARPPRGLDEWGVEWHNIGVCNLGEVKTPALQDWNSFDRLKFPDLSQAQRWEKLPTLRALAGERFMIGSGISLYERVHFLRGLENTWVDVHEAPGQLGMLIDLLVDMNLIIIEHYARADVDGFMIPDDWGLQNRLMIAPASWRSIWKPRYKRLFNAVHQAGLYTFLHSCGHIVDILDDLIDIGLDVIHMDQQENMGLENLGRRFGGRLNFFAPVDIQATMARGRSEEIRAYCRSMAQHLGRPLGGFLPRWYSDPQGAGHTAEAIDAMCQEFLAINRERQESVE